MLANAERGCLILADISLELLRDTLAGEAARVAAS